MTREPPGASDLFINVWNNALTNDDAGDSMVRPGMPGFGKTFGYWCRVWRDCCDLAREIESGQGLAERAFPEPEEKTDAP
jgi:hypothetical protein